MQPVNNEILLRAWNNLTEEERQKAIRHVGETINRNLLSRFMVSAIPGPEKVYFDCNGNTHVFNAGSTNCICGQLKNEDFDK